MPKLYELLPAETDLSSSTRGLIEQLKVLFSKSDKYIGFRKVYEPLEADSIPVADEGKEVPRNLLDDLVLLQDKMLNWIDVSIQKEETNKVTSAELQIGDRIVNLSTPALLNLEAKLQELRLVLERVPTLDTAQRWTFDKNLRYWKSDTTITYRTESRVQYEVIVPATDKFPAQTAERSVKFHVGNYENVNFASALPLAQKRDMLERLKELILNVRTARQRANDVEVDSIKLGESIMSHILGVALS